MGEHEYQLFQHTVEVQSPVARDFAVYYVAGRVALGEGAGRLYYVPPGPTKAARAHNQLFVAVPPDTDWSRTGIRILGFSPTYYIYPPFCAWLFSPLTHLSPRAAYFLWRALSTVMLLMSTYLILRAFLPKVDLAAFLIAGVGVLSFFPFAEALYEGQVGCLILFLWTLGFYCMRTRRINASAACFAVGTLVKVTPAIAVPIMLLRRQWKWLLSYSATLTILLGASIWRLGWASHWTYATQVFPLLSTGFEGYPLKSLSTVLRNLYLGRGIFQPSDSWQIPTSLGWLITAANLSLFAGVLFLLLKRKQADEVVLSSELAIVALVSLIVSPIVWRHHYVLVLLPLLSAWLQSRSSATNARLGALALITLTLGTPFSDLLLNRLHPGMLQALLSAVFLVASCWLLVFCVQDQRRDGQSAAESFSPTVIAA